MIRPALLAAATLAASFDVAPAGAQNRFAVCPGFTPNRNIEYDGRFAFVRIQYYVGFGGRPIGRGRNMGGWSHDYPTAECHFNKLFANLTTVRTRQDGSLILTLDDPEIFKYPMLYLSEPGAWYPSEREVLGLRNYLKKGGVLIFDDFDGPDIYNVERQMQLVLPGMEMIRLTEKHPIFDTFYRVRSLEFHHPMMPGLKSSFYGIFEDNDPRKRLMAIVNNDNDIGDYWEWSDVGQYGIDPSNEAYKLGINYMIWIFAR